MIGLKENQDKIIIHINPEPVHQANITLNSRLLKLAKIHGKN
jgi:hypothetical protein